jgi:pimeloyl-ACP methyl ester carboxylesterase
MKMADSVRTQRYPNGNLILVGDEGGPDGAPLVVLLHGGGQTRHAWGGAMNRLMGAGYHVINFDSRGHGESDWAPDGDYSMDARASDVGAVMSGIDAPTALVGASMGGISAFFALGKQMVSAKALILVDIVLRPAQAGVEKIMTFMRANPDGFASLEEAAAAVAAYNPARPPPKDPKGLLKNLRLRDDGRLYWHWDPLMLSQRPSPEPPQWVDELLELSSKVRIPTLLVRGGRSDIVDDRSVEEFLRLVPQAEVYEVPGAGHMVAGDSNDAFNTAIIDFLRRHLPPGSSAGVK